MPIDASSEIAQSFSFSEVLFLVLLLGIPLTLMVLIFVQHILGYLLAKKYDDTFFKTPYFTEGEIGVYSSWPLSLIRFATYIIYSAFPLILHRRRFKGHTSPYKPNLLMRLSCQLWLVMLVSCIIAVPILILLIVV